MLTRNQQSTAGGTRSNSNMNMHIPLCVSRRLGHIVVPYGNGAVAWGGFDPALSLTYWASNEVFFYDSTSGIWSKVVTTGDDPHYLSGCSAAIWQDNLYVFGGAREAEAGDAEAGDAEAGTHRTHFNDLYRLNLRSCTWTKLTPGGPRSPPSCDKGVAWAHNNKIYIYGGYGPRPFSLIRGYDFSLDVSVSSRDNGWNNSFFCYDIASGDWDLVKVKGFLPTPEPRAACAADVKGDIAFVFGGRKGTGRTNDLYAFNMSTQSWSANLNAGLKSGEVPEPRSWTSFDFVEDSRAIIYGGLNAYDQPAMDWWECRFNEFYDRVAWSLGKCPIEPRIWHASAFCSSGELVIVGGGTKNPYDMDKNNHVKSMSVLNCQPPALYRLSLDAVTDGFLLSAGFIGRGALPRALQDLVECRHSQRGIPPSEPIENVSPLRR